MASAPSTDIGGQPDSLLIFDVGANVGNKAARFLDSGARVVCFEPVPECVAALRSRFACQPLATVVPYALGSSIQSLSMSISSAGTTVSTFSEAWKHGRFKDITWDKTLEVPVRPLDHAIAEHGLPDYCKIDVEGFELSVLQGLSQPIPVLSFEFCSEGLAQTAACLAHLESLGYRRFNVVYGEGDTMRHGRWLGVSQLLTELREHPCAGAWGDVYAAHGQAPRPSLASLLPALPASEDIPTNHADTLSQLSWRGLAYTGAPLRLHLGCGKALLPGYVNIDYPAEHHHVTDVRPDFAADIVTLAFPPQSVDEVRLHHVFEHFNRVVALGLLIRWQSWLRPGGTLLIETPDFEYEVRAFLGYPDPPPPLAHFSFRQPRPFLGTAKRRLQHLLMPRKLVNRSFSDRMAAIRSLEGDQTEAWAYHVGHWFAARFEQTLSKIGFSKIIIEHRLSGHAPPLHNIVVSAERDQDRSEKEQLETGYKLLWNSVVTETERPSWEIWCQQLRQFLRKGQSPGLPLAHEAVPEPEEKCGGVSGLHA